MWATTTTGLCRFYRPSSAVTADSCLCETNILMGKAVNSKDTHNIEEHDKEDNYYTIDYLHVYL